MQQRIGTNYLNCVGHNIIQVDATPGHLFFFYHAADVADDVAGAARISADVSEQLTDLF